MNSELIERLKDNKIHAIFDDLKPEAKACLREVGFENCEWLTCSGDGVLWMQTEEGGFLPHLCYRIKANYQPTPGYIDCKVIEEKNGYYFVTCPGGEKLVIYTLPAMVGFMGFRTAKDDCVQLTDVSVLMNAKYCVMARFRI